MKRVLVLAVGKLKDPLLDAACADYFRRCSRRFRAEVREVKTLSELHAALPQRCTLVALDERGQQHRSVDLATLLQGWLERPEPDVVFAIGGAGGLDDALRRRAHHLLSLSQLTFAHRLVRLLLAEQLYRAVSILEGSPYHREG